MEWCDSFYPKYEVSNTGLVRNKKTQRILKSYLGRVNIDGQPRIIGRLVAQAYIPIINNKSEIDHIDKNPLNNNVYNLRWVNRSENCINRESPNGDLRYIYHTKTGFCVKIKRHNFNKTYKTLEEAIIARSDFD